MGFKPNEVNWVSRVADPLDITGESMYQKWKKGVFWNKSVEGGERDLCVGG